MLEDISDVGSTRQWKNYLLAIIISALAFLIKVELWEIIGAEAPFILLTLAVVLTTWIAGIRAGLLSVVITSVLSTYFLHPFGSFNIDPDDRSDLVLNVIQSLILWGAVSWIHITRSKQIKTTERLSRELEARHLAEKRLKDSEHELRAALQTLNSHVANTPLAVVEYDRAFRLVRWNARAEQIFGWSAGEVIGRSLGEWSWIYTEDETQVVLHVGSLTSGQKTVFSRNRNYRKDGSVAWMEWYNSAIYDESGQIISVLSIGQDVTEHHLAEEALREREREFTTMANFIPALAWMADQNGDIVWYNQRWYDFTGTSLSDMKQFGWESVHHPDEVERVVERFQQCIAEGKSWEDTFPLRGKDGEYRWFLSRAVAIRNEEGQVVRWFGTNTDITERRELEEQLAQRESELRALTESLEQRVHERTRELDEAIAQLELAYQELEMRNRDLEEFAHVTSHDLQEPLRKIRSFADMLQSEFQDRLDDTGRFYLNRMTDASTRMSRLINDILAFSRISFRGKEFNPVDLNAIMLDVLSDLELNIKESGGSVEVDRLPVVEADASQMHLLFQNLVANGLKFHHDNVPPHVTVTAQTYNGGQVEITVADNGIGFDPKYLDRIFTPFQRLHGRSKFAGSGIGLAICRRIVERHGGSITAESTPGHGSRFIVRIPLRQQLAEGGADRSRAAVPA